MPPERRKRTDRYRKHKNALKRRGLMTCWLCGRPCPEDDCEGDHVIPHSRGGSGHRVNIKTAHGKCNRARNAHGTDPLFINNTPTLEDFLAGRVISFVAATTVTLDARMWSAWWSHPLYVPHPANRNGS